MNTDEVIQWCIDNEKSLDYLGRYTDFSYRNGWTGYYCWQTRRSIAELLS
jgi:hypothetical protein